MEFQNYVSTEEEEPSQKLYFFKINVKLFLMWAGDFIKESFTLFIFRRLEYTRDQLHEFKKQLDDKVGRGHAAEQGGGFGGFGGFGGGATEVSEV